MFGFVATYSPIFVEQPVCIEALKVCFLFRLFRVVLKTKNSGIPRSLYVVFIVQSGYLGLQNFCDPPPRRSISSDCAVAKFTHIYKRTNLLKKRDKKHKSRDFFARVLHKSTRIKDSPLSLFPNAKCFFQRYFKRLKCVFK